MALQVRLSRPQSPQGVWKKRLAWTFGIILAVLISLWVTRGCYEVCTKIGAYVGGRCYSVWRDGEPGESRLSERRFG